MGQSDARSEVVGRCVAQRAQASGSVGRLCSRAASSAHERDGEMEASGDSLPETSRVVQHSIVRPKSLLSAFLSRWMDAWLSKASWCRTTVDDVEVTALRECAAECPVPKSQ